MRMPSGRVVDGRVQLIGAELPEGTKVSVVWFDDAAPDDARDMDSFRGILRGMPTDGVRQKNERIVDVCVELDDVEFPRRE